MLSLMILMVFVVVVWSVAVVIHNMAVLNGATELSAQEALIVYDRQNYRGFDAGNVPGGGTYIANQVANSVFSENIRPLLGGHGASNKGVVDQIIVECGPDISSLSVASCSAGNPDMARVERIRVIAHAQAPFFLLGFMQKVPAVNKALTLHSTGEAVYSGPVGQ